MALNIDLGGMLNLTDVALSPPSAEILSLKLNPLVDIKLGAGSSATTGSISASAVVNLGVDLGTGSTSSGDGLLSGLFGGGTAPGGMGLTPGGVVGVGQTIIDLTHKLIGGSASADGVPVTSGTTGMAINGTEGSDTLHGSAKNDTIRGWGGNDAIFGHGGKDIVDGGSGIDTFGAGGAISQYVAAAENGILAIHNRTSGDIAYLANVERIQFSDNKVLALDLNGNAGQAFRLYQAALDRAPEPAGLKFHVSALDAGMSLHDDAASFVASAEFQQKYGANLTDSQFVTAL